MPDLSDDELLVLYRDGDADAFGVLFDRYRTSAFNFAYMMLHDVGRAEDVLQETFLAVARSAKGYEARGRFRTWLMRIVRNRCLNEIESARVRRGVVALSGLEIIDPPASDASPVDRAASNEYMVRLRGAISDLPERQREAIVLYAFDQMGYREIADVMEVPINTVKTLIHRARAALAAATRDDDREGDDDV